MINSLNEIKCFDKTNLKIEIELLFNFEHLVKMQRKWSLCRCNAPTEAPFPSHPNRLKTTISCIHVLWIWGFLDSLWNTWWSSNLLKILTKENLSIRTICLNWESDRFQKSSRRPSVFGTTSSLSFKFLQDNIIFRYKSPTIQ